MAPKARFTDGEKVLCFHGPLLYEAKCLSSQIRDKHMKYFIHYSGWNKNWDEWVPECRVLKYNETNLQKQKDLQKTHMKAKKSKNTKTGAKKDAEKEKEPTPPTPVVPEKPKQIKAVKRDTSLSSLEERPSKKAPAPEPPVETKKVAIKAEPKAEPTFMDEPQMETKIKFNIPKFLQLWLMDDCDLINHQKKILHLPARITVDHIIASYIKERVSVKGLSPTTETAIVQIANQIRDLFNVVLGNKLLYKFERPQYGEMLAEHSNLQRCEIYGAIHLLRMFTVLEELLTDSQAIASPDLISQIEDFIQYLAANPSFFSYDDYIVAAPEYHRRALT